MKWILTLLLGRLPIGWLQLQHNRTRLIAAVGGVTFANVLIFMQLGFMNALFETSVLTHRGFVADIVLVSSNFRTLREASPLPQRRMFEALGIAGVESATPIYISTLNWTDPRTGDTTNFRVLGVDPDQTVFNQSILQNQLRRVREPDTAILDRRMRDFPRAIQEAIDASGKYDIEASGRTLTVRGLFDQGASFDVDGCLVVSDQTFLRLFPQRTPGTPTLVLLQCHKSSDLREVAKEISRRFPETDTIALTKEQFVSAEQSYQARQTPIGFVFGFGVAIGLVVGLVIVYQVLSTDVQDHLSEYATFKAIGYSQRYFLGIVLEEAICLSALGFVPGLFIALVLYFVAANATALPIAMPWTRPVLVFCLTATMCTISGAIATQRLQTADPADLF